jgi:hypothetical protein
MLKKPGRSGQRNYLREYWESSDKYFRQLAAATRVALALDQERANGDLKPKLTAAYAAADHATRDTDHTTVAKAWRRHKKKFVSD